MLTILYTGSAYPISPNGLICILNSNTAYLNNGRTTIEIQSCRCATILYASNVRNT